MSIKSSSVRVELGSTGKPEERTCSLIYPEGNSFWKTVPSSNDIVRTIREFKKRHKQFTLLTSGVTQYPPQIPKAEAISLHENPELIYLHCMALVQAGNSDLLVTDGCGFGFSENFANYINSQNWSWVTEFKSKALVDHYDSTENMAKQVNNKSKKYDRISKPIRASKSGLSEIQRLDVKSTFYEQDYKRKIEDGVKNLYLALEWSLRQVVAENSAFEWEQVFSSNNYRDNERLLVKFAEKLGFIVNDRNQSLLQVKPGAIRQSEKGKVELQPLLALTIAGASGDANHPFHRLAHHHSGFLTHVLRLKKYRDPIEHGSTDKLNIDDKKLEDLLELTVPMIISLVPGVADDLAIGESVVSGEDINQNRLRANIELEKALGTAFVSHLNIDMKNQLIRSELLLERYTPDTNIEIIKCYASVMQIALLDAVMDRRNESEIESVKENAIENILQAGFFASIEQVPKQLTTVGAHHVKRAVFDLISTTLGAQLLAIFVLGSKDELNQLHQSEPGFIDLVTSLIQLRGHGNDQNSELSRDDIELLKNKVFETIKRIKEVF